MTNSADPRALVPPAASSKTPRNLRDAGLIFDQGGTVCRDRLGSDTVPS